jgi:ribosomal protein L29
MSLAKYKEVENFPSEQIQNELFLLRRQLFELKAKRAQKRTISSHLFSHTKRRIAHLKFRESTFLTTIKMIEKTEERE